jgi:glycosyltransferase involved in cell wall biosynthesis
MVRRIWKGAHRVISVADGLRELALTTWPKGDIAVIPNGVDTEYFRPAGDVSPKGDNAPMRAVVTAQLIERKGIQYLVEAIASMDEAYRQRLHVDVCGVGPYGASLRQQVSATGMEGCVTFRGLLEHEKMAELLRGADLFILPSLQEGTPVAVLEAMACGLPVIATKVGGLPALAADRRAVLLVEPGSSSQLQAALKQVMDDSGLRVELGHEARRVALEHGWHTVWQEYLRVLERNNA